MTILADFMRDNSGNVLRIYPDVLGELHITSDQWGSDDGAWSSPAYTIPTEGYEYRTLADSAGTTWYAYLVKVEAGDDTHWEITLSTTAPTAQPDGVWRDPKYGAELVETDAVVGSEIYLAFQDVSSTNWYVYPTIDGEFKITTTLPA
jgi:hypothetical protein